jgi:hypothetical protein
MQSQEPRITWSQGRHGMEGHVGTYGKAFTIYWHTARSDPAWTLTSSLPGFVGREVKRDDQDELKAVAEQWLRDLVASLGAAFPGEG